MLDHYIDMHCLDGYECIEELIERLEGKYGIKEMIHNIQYPLTPNNGDGHNHILNINCGACKDRKAGPKLQTEIYDFLEADGYQFFVNKKQGIFLVRLEKEI